MKRWLVCLLFMLVLMSSLVSAQGSGTQEISTTINYDENCPWYKVKCSPDFEDQHDCPVDMDVIDHYFVPDIETLNFDIKHEKVTTSEGNAAVVWKFIGRETSKRNRVIGTMYTVCAAIPNLQNREITDISQAPRFVEAFTLMLNDIYSEQNLEKRKEIADTAYKLAVNEQDKLNRQSLADMLIAVYKNEVDLEILNEIVSAMGELKDDDVFIHLARELRDEDVSEDLKSRLWLALSNHGPEANSILQSIGKEDICSNLDRTTGIYDHPEPVFVGDKIQFEFKTREEELDVEIYTNKLFYPSPGIRDYRWSPTVISNKEITGGEEKEVKVEIYREHINLTKGYVIAIYPKKSASNILGWLPGKYIGLAGVVYETDLFGTAIEDKLERAANNAFPFVGPKTCGQDIGSNVLDFSYSPANTTPAIYYADITTGLENKRVPLFRNSLNTYDLVSPVYFVPESCNDCISEEKVKAKEHDDILVTVEDDFLMVIEDKEHSFDQFMNLDLLIATKEKIIEVLFGGDDV